MNLTVQSDYAFRTLMFLASRAPRGSTIQEIAEHYRISRGHLMVLVHRLGHHGFLKTSRGRGGGIQLARPAEEIRLGEIVRAIEPNFQLVECFNTEINQCLISGHCLLHDVLNEALAAWMKVLDSYTLADLTSRNPKLLKLLSPAPGPRKSLDQNR